MAEAIPASPEVLKTLRALLAKAEDKPEPQWKLLGQRTSNGAWTISGCTPGKPVFLVMRSDSYNWNYSWFVVLSGAEHADTLWDGKGNAQYLLGGDSVVSTNVGIVIPTSTVCSVALRQVTGKLTVYAFG